MQKIIYQTYSPYIQLLRSLNFDPGILNLLDQTIQSIPSDPKLVYEWTNNYTKIVKMFNNF